MVSQALTRFGEAIHSAAATTGTSSAAEQAVASNTGAAGPFGGGSDRVVDAEFEEVDAPQQRRQA
jgi:molecular chaperone DnaK